MHKFASDLVLMFLGWTPTKFVKIELLTLFSMYLVQFFANSKKSSLKSLTRNFHIWFGESPGDLVFSLLK